jgi:Flp pilus assembly protein TadD
MPARPDAVRRAVFYAAVAGLALLFIAVSVQKIWAGDFWGQLRTGEWILQHRAVPTADEYTWTRAGTPWVEVRWLYEVAIALGWRVGPWFLCLGQAALLGATWLILFWPSRAALRNPAGLGVLALGLAAGAGRWVLRPELVTDLMLAVFLVALDAASTRRRIGRAWLLVLAQALWTNSHSVYALGPILAWTFAGSAVAADLFARVRARDQGRPPPLVSRFSLRFVLLAGAITAACLVNPYFARGALYALEMYREAGASSAVGQTLGELRSPFAMPLDQWTWDLWAALALFVAVSATFVLNARRVPLARAIVFCAACVLAAGAQRNAALLAIMGTWAGLANLRDAPAVRPALRSSLARAAPLAHAGIALITAALGWYIITDRASISIGAPKEFGLGVVEWDTPRGAADFLVRSGAPAPIFNNMRDGHYLGWRSAGAIKVFIDGRTDIAGDDLVRDTATISAQNWDRRAAAWNISTAVLPVRGFEDLVGYLARSGDWALVYLDHRNVIFMRRGPARDEYITRHRIDLSKPWTRRAPEPDDRPPRWKAVLGGPSRAWYVQGMAETFLALGAIGNADQYLVRSLQERPGNPRPLSQHAAILRFAGQPAEADRIWSDLPRAWRQYSDALVAPWLIEGGRSAEAIPVLTRLVAGSPRDRSLQVALADAHFKTGAYSDARAHYERAAALGHDAAPEWMKLGYACNALGDSAAAARAYQRSLRRDPRQHQVWGLLGGVYLAQGDLPAARQAFQSALQLTPDYEPARRALEALSKERSPKE